MSNIPAFPLHDHGTQTLGMHVTGMTLRDYFAAMAMSEMTWQTKSGSARECYEIADAMLEARK